MTETRLLKCISNQTSMKRVETERWQIEQRVTEKYMGVDRIPFLLVGLIFLQDSDRLYTFRKVGLLAE